ncbi:hypothetical protein BDF19DRAFT_435830 [Syncephalis fuscata]|nr:hypothetical protein BDF19DRAFT_435830 [Syncephalis fuscata]
MGATNSKTNTPNNIYDMTKRCANGKAVVLKGLGHIMVHEKPDTVGRRIFMHID